MGRCKQVREIHETKKIHSRSPAAFTTVFARIMNLKSTLLLLVSAVVLASAPGCNFFRKSKKPKPNPHIAVQVETEFKDRWMDRRLGELTAGGVDATTAREQAEAEFRRTYPHLRINSQGAARLCGSSGQ